jgi:hypothetical protein
VFQIKKKYKKHNIFIDIPLSRTSRSYKDHEVLTSSAAVIFAVCYSYEPNVIYIRILIETNKLTPKYHEYNGSTYVPESLKVMNVYRYPKHQGPSSIIWRVLGTWLSYSLVIQYFSLSHLKSSKDRFVSKSQPLRKIGVANSVLKII